MGQYKVPQNVEAEDHILGPLTFKQFIYACIGVGWALICFALFRAIPALMVVLGAPPTLLFLMLGFYTRDGQNFEQILLAMIGFFTAPRQRLWVKENVVESLRIEPVKPVAEVTQANPAEVRSELEKLASLIDSRGWNKPPAPDNANPAFQPATAHADRMVIPQAPVHAGDEPAADMLDLKNSPLAQNLSQLLTDAATQGRQAVVDQMGNPTSATYVKSTPQPESLGSPSASGVTPARPGDILKLATSSNDLTVSQVAAQATRLGSAPAAKSQVEPNTNYAR